MHCMHMITIVNSNCACIAIKIVYIQTQVKLIREDIDFDFIITMYMHTQKLISTQLTLRAIHDH
jgi:hypothetical protein